MIRYVIEDGMHVRCGFCDTDQRWEGKGKDSRKVCDCNSEPPAAALPAEKPGRRKCSKKNTARKGREGERETVKWAEGRGHRAFRTAGSGAHGTRNNEDAFSTDVRVALPDDTLKFEVKRHSTVRGLKTLLGFKQNSDVLWMREDLADTAYVLMSVSALERYADGCVAAALAAEAKR